MKQVRCGVFETNSSSTHSLTMCAADDYLKWEKGEVFLNNGAGWASFSKFKDKDFVTREEAIDILVKNKYPPKDNLNELGEEELIDFFRENDICTFKNYGSEDLEWFEDTYVTKSGEKIIAFGQFGYDG